ncbi:FadR/GntR family transcriptional regulator [Trinickia caryophylli]|uniref:Transcriptional regulator, GntR family n=1 Tax=Trinickia caryophylli TaxID=28094 RepID=A0A1X7CI77_TRICW|nr:FadR/GntR family transcriptional regulator [Trinickia caryophylli]PMS11572.1 FadR family transcriptional regulator [Trinickia caryophylli]TRX19875.1 FadR family transcriptional regulator [Trinickia caryophylli]WQE12791.1 FadR/GntR family transcriptional regulator [Trinickia caryophylli]SME96543.1 transcriptional regulator, GntR family [Trinickia caryophylli]GLU30506.1 GntR family transcriptional regulator [Trinickia caryophylli]
MSAPPLNAASPRRARNLAEFVVNQLVEQIEASVLKPGDKLPTESQLMESMNVSRTVIREAISRLQAAKVIETRHGIGSFVLEPAAKSVGFNVAPGTTLRDVLHILELRISLETECAGLAAQRAQPDDLARMRAALDTLIATHSDEPASVEADLHFHIAVAQATGNRYFVDILTQLGTALIPRERIDSAGIAHEDPGIYLSTVNGEHESIYDAIARRDAESARAAMRMHLSNSRERLRRANATAMAVESHS